MYIYIYISNTFPCFPNLCYNLHPVYQKELQAGYNKHKDFTNDYSFEMVDLGYMCCSSATANILMFTR